MIDASENQESVIDTQKKKIESEADRKWLENVSQAVEWEPNYDGIYNLVVIGGGPAGLVAAASAAGLGAKVALIESNKMGGDCLNVGCVPSKSLIQAARKHTGKQEGYPQSIHPIKRDDFDAVMENLRRTRANLSEHDSIDRFRKLGVDVFIGHGKFCGKDKILVNETTLRFKKAMIATGATASTLPGPGAKEVDFHTNETIFDIESLPKSLIVIGGGTIGCEMSQAFTRLGSKVTQIEKSSHLLSREDKDASSILLQTFIREGTDVRLNASVQSLSQRGTTKYVSIVEDGKEREISAEEILVCVGRTPNVNGLELEKAGISFDTKNGIQVNDFLQTTNPRVFAAGDVASLERFTHAADFMARIVVQNALFLGKRRLSSLIIPRCTYTVPEIGHVGIGSNSGTESKSLVTTQTIFFNEVDRASIDGDTEGFVRIHLKKGTDQIMGATVVNPNAGELISMITLAMTNQIGLKKIASTIFPYPTRSEAIRKLGDQYNRTRLTPRILNVFKKWLQWNR